MMNGLKITAASLWVMAMMVILAPSSAQAACSNPAGDEGKVIYNSDHKVVQFCNGTDWIGMAGGRSSTAGDSMVAGWPDAIVCNLTTPSWGTVVLYAMHMPIGSNYYYRSPYTTSSAVYDVIFNSDGSFQGFQGITVTPDCNGKSISQLYADGQAFNFVGGQGDNSGASVTEALRLEDADNNTIIQVEESSDENKIRFDTAGTERMIIDASGNVGIGTTNPLRPLTVRGSGVAAGRYNIVGIHTSNGNESVALGYEANGSIHTKGFVQSNNSLPLVLGTLTSPDALTVLDNGNVGIGTTNPGSKLHLYSTDNTLNYLDVQNVSTTDSAGSIIRLITTDTADTGTSVVNLVKYNSGGFFINNTETAAAAHTSFGIGGTTHMRISSSGNVGIGTPTPADKLHVSGGGFVSSNTGAGGNPNFIARAHPTADQGEIGTTTAHPQTFITSSTERMRIDASGNVGIGTSSPSDGSGSGGQALKLDVAGAVGATHYCDADGLNCTTAAALGGTADNLGSGGTTTGNIVMNNASPTLFFQDTDHSSGMIHMNSHFMQFLTAGTNSTSWAINGTNWPMAINMTNDQITIGGDMIFGEGTLYPKYISVDPQDGTNEGGEILLEGAASYGDTAIDNFQGNVRIHTLASGKQFQVLGGSGVSAVAYFHSSDERLKDNIETSSGLDLITKLRGVSYDWKSDGTASAGVIAQEVEKVLPSAVKTGDDGMKSVEYDQIIAPLIEAVKELKAENDNLRARIQNLEEGR